MRKLRQIKSAHWLLTVAALLAMVFVVGCDEYVRVIRDHDVRIPKNATWAWRPAPQEAAATADNRAVTSRDTISHNPTPRREAEADDAVDRERVKAAIEKTLNEKGFKQVPDPAAAEFLVDYKFAVKRGNAAVPAAYPGAYPGLVCGPFRCWQTWGYGPAYAGYENIQFREGTIVFDWMQKAPRHLVYRAIGVKPVRYDSFSLTEGDIRGLVHALLGQLKPGK